MECEPAALAELAIMATISPMGGNMQHVSAREAKNGFGRLIDLARASPVAVEKHGRPVVVVMAVEEFQCLTSGWSKKADGAEGKEQK